MLSKSIEEALNRQLNWELYSSYVYYSMAAYFDSIDLAGASQWMKSQTQEEVLHATKFYDYIVERGGRVVMDSIPAPKTEWASPIEAFEDALHHEEDVTRRINDIMNLAVSERDHATQIFLQWFISEQVEEEASVNAVVQKLKLAGGSPGGLFMIDRELAARPLVFQPPAASQAD